MLSYCMRIKKFRQYLKVKLFTIITDHVILKMIKTADLLKERRVR